jgi:hypothetical protein
MRLKRRFAGADQVVMDVRPGRIALYAGLAIVAAAVLWIVIEAAGRPVALAVAITAIVVLAASYMWFGVLVVRSLGDLDATKRKPLPRARAAIPMMFGMPRW